MKLSLLLSLSLMSTTPAVRASAQWTWQNPMPTGNPLQDVCFVDANNGWAVGLGGTIIHTTNGGRDWNHQFELKDFVFVSVWFVDGSNGWALGGSYPLMGDQFYEGHSIYRTTDGGAHWNLLWISSEVSLTDISFVDPLHGWMAGARYYSSLPPYGAILLYTTDGGTSWSSQLTSPGSRAGFSALYFVDPNNGYVVGADSSGRGVIFHTTNGGSVWGQTASGPRQFYSIHFVDASNGWAAGYDTLLHTTDSGNSWLVHSIGLSRRARSVWFTSASEGWVLTDSLAGVQFNPRLLRTTNGGGQWTAQSIHVFGTLHFEDPMTGWIVGGNTILHTTDAGANWVDQVHATTLKSLMSVRFVDSNNGWAVGDTGTILRTTNGGGRWTLQPSGHSNRFSSVFFVDVDNGWVVGSEGLVLRSTDGGEHWSQQNSGTNLELRSVCFSDTVNGWAVGGGSSPSSFIILHTTDGGILWTTQLSGNTTRLNAVCFVDANVGWTVGGRTLYTTDGGVQWIDQMPNHPYLSSVSFIDRDNGWAGGGGVVYRTTNGGAVWSQAYLPGFWALTCLFFASATDGWAADQGFETPSFARTTDGGINWSYEIYPALWGPASVHFSDLSNGWIVGGNGTILHTTNGGVTFVEPPRNAGAPAQFVLEQNYPNPFNPKTEIGFRIADYGLVSLRVYDLLGREVATLVNEVKQPGTYTVQWDGRELASGVYLYRLSVVPLAGRDLVPTDGRDGQVGSFVEVKKLLLLK